jgi:hypothetical protein
VTSTFVLTLVEHHDDTSVTQQVWTVGEHFAQGMRKHLGEPIAEAAFDTDEDLPALTYEGTQR